MLSMIIWLAASPAFAKPLLVSSADSSIGNIRIHADVYYDREKKRPELTVVFDQAKTPNEDGDHFTASTMSDQLASDDWLLRPAPVSRIDGESLFVYSAFRVKDGLYDFSRDYSLLFKVPAGDLDEHQLAFLKSRFPRAIVTDGAGKPRYVKALLVKITPSQAYPVAAFDLDPSMAGPN